MEHFEHYEHFEHFEYFEYYEHFELGLLTSSKLLYRLPAITDYWIENWSIGMATQAT